MELRNLKRISFRDSERDAVLEKLLECQVIPPLELDRALQFETRQVRPRFGLRVAQLPNPAGEEHFQAHFLLDYGPGWMEETSFGSGIWLSNERVYLRPRRSNTENAARDTLKALGLRQVDRRQPNFTQPNGGRAPWRLALKSMPRVVRELLQSGWHVEAEGKAFRQAGPVRVDVSSGIDWFELRAEVDYGDATVSLPQLLEALRRGDTMVALGDGSFGMLPEDWLQRFAPSPGWGPRKKDHLRFRRNQAGLLDALLAAQPEVRVDEVFERARQGLRCFQGVRAAAQPEGFVGQLRDYQREGVGWMEFLREFGFGGCLADDMGVGKTAQVLAVLEIAGGRTARARRWWSAPKSLMFNWREEAARFTPALARAGPHRTDAATWT